MPPRDAAAAPDRDQGRPRVHRNRRARLAGGLPFRARAPARGAPRAGTICRCRTPRSWRPTSPAYPGSRSSSAAMGGSSRRRTADTLRFEHAASPATAVYRVEAKLPSAPGTPPVPWIVGNPIFIGPSLPRVRPSPARLPGRRARSVVFDGGDVARWRVEQDAASAGGSAPRRRRGAARLSHSNTALGPATRAGQYAALVAGVGQGGLSRWTRVQLQGGRAMRRCGSPCSCGRRRTGARWRRSVVSTRAREMLIVPFADMVAVDAAPVPIPLG